MVDVAQLVERRFVVPVVVGSIPIVHPISRRLIRQLAVNELENAFLILGR